MFRDIKELRWYLVIIIVAGAVMAAISAALAYDGHVARLGTHAATYGVTA